MLSTKNSPDIISGLNNNLERLKMSDNKVMITVLRPFRFEGARVEIGDQFEVNKPFAGEMIAASKAKLVRIKINSPETSKKIIK